MTHRKPRRHSQRFQQARKLYHLGLTIKKTQDFIFITNGPANDDAILHHLRSLQFRLSKYEDWN
jgi:hypothetical protein